MLEKLIRGLLPPKETEREKVRHADQGLCTRNKRATVSQRARGSQKEPERARGSRREPERARESQRALESKPVS